MIIKDVKQGLTVQEQVKHNNIYRRAPHIRTITTTATIMTDVCVSLIPATFFGIGMFGAHAALIILTGVLSAVISELIFQLLTHREVTVNDMSAFLTGLLLSLTLPPTVPLWIPAVGSAFAIIIVKQLYGGIGCNIMNPALAARCFLHISFAKPMTEYICPLTDAVSSATPLEVLKTSSMTQVTTSFSAGNSIAPQATLFGAGNNIDLGGMFLGITAGTIGEVSVMAIIAGGMYLVYRKVITVCIPMAYITSFIGYIVIYSLISNNGIDIRYIGAHMFGGGLLFGIIFMATDYVTSPMSFAGKCIYGAFAGVLTGILRIHGTSAEGVSYAILCANMIVPLIDGKCACLRR
ncbi:MAG: RnfABCDGE type electron transport complex subunit D [Lachnospiraceae bacterium]|nr:RnfABCDGE type electron transport complex subunit D [Lachnospiraceae bacterium]